MRKSIIYILLSMISAVSCTKDVMHPCDELEGNKVLIDFSVQIHDHSVATRALAEKPALRNLMVAVFDGSGYLLEYTFATEMDYATENATDYDYKVALTQSNEQRIIHFIGNAPDKLIFGVEEKVLSTITSSIGDNDDDGIYWCRRVVPAISGTNSGGSMLLADDTPAPNAPIYQADVQTRVYFSNIGLIRNFSRIQLVAKSTSNFDLKRYFIVGTPKSGLAAAYNNSNGQFVNYYKGNPNPNPEDDLDDNIFTDDNGNKSYYLGSPKTYSEILSEGYNANILPTSERFSIADSEFGTNWISNGASAYVYESEKPLKAEDAIYIIAYGTYSGDGKDYYYKIDFRDENGYFPLIRNFKYSVTINNVTRSGYETIEKAANSAGSGDISTSLETKNLTYISDGEASLEVEYIEKYIVTNNKDVTLNYEFMDNVANSTYGNYEDMWIEINAAGATGVSILKVNGDTYTVDEPISIAKNPGVLTITPVEPTDVPKSQTLTLFARCTNGSVLQRTVNYIVQSRRTMVVSLTPSEVPEGIGSEFDVNISLPAGLSKSIFPLEFLIESGSLSINPHNEQMPVRTGMSLIDNTKSSFYFVKTLNYSDYNSESGAINIVDCHFKTIKPQSATHIYAANPYFITQYDYEGTVSDLDAGGNSVYLDTYHPETFSMLSFSDNNVGVGENIPVSFSFNMSDIPDDGKVYVSLGNLMPAASENQLTYYGLEGGKSVYIFEPQNNIKSGTFQLQTAHFDGELSVDLSAHKFIAASKSANRNLYNFSGSFNKDYLTGLAEQVQYTFYLTNYYYEGMIIEVEMKGLQFNEGKLPADWDKWRDMGNGVYAVEYKPSSFLNSVTMNLIPTIHDISEDCVITVKSKGYKTETDTIRALSINNKTIKFTFDINHGTINKYETTLTSITASDPDVSITYTNFTSNRNDNTQPYTFEATVSGLKIENAKDDTKITFRIRCFRNTTRDYTFEYTATMSELVELFKANTIPTIHLGQK